MRKNDRLLAGVVLVIALALGGILYYDQAKGHHVVVTMDGEEYGTYSLKKDQVIEIGDTNRLEIANGQARMIYAHCPDQICVHMAPISKEHEMIVCMPNRVIAEVFEN